MRIVTVLTSLGVGGAEKHALAVAERLAKRGHVVAFLVLMPRLEEEWPCKFETVYLGIRKTPVSALAALGRARNFLREFCPDVVHSHSFHANIFARILKLCLPRLAVVSTVHNVNEGGRMRMLAYRLTDPLSCKTVAVSTAAADRFVHIKAIPARKSLVLTIGINTDDFAPDATRRAQTRTAEGASGGFIWYTAGRLVPAKDYPNLLRAFRMVREEFLDAELWISGAPADATVKHDADGTAHYVRLIGVEHGCMERVRWLGFRRDQPSLLDAADGFVLGSAWEGMPQALCEAMAMEKPFVATDVGGVREMAADTGVLVASRDSAALANAMKVTMRQSREEQAAAGRRARERVVRNFSVEAVADRWEALYHEIVA